MKAFNGDPALKAALIAKATQHRLADAYRQGSYGWMESGLFKGCSLGCTIHDINQIKDLSGKTNDHAFLAQQLGIPEFITALQDKIFEGLAPDLAHHWTERLLTAIPVEADLTPLLPDFLLSLLDRLPPQEGEVKGDFKVVQN